MRLSCRLAGALFPCLLLFGFPAGFQSAEAGAGEVRFGDSGFTLFGNWEAQAVMTPNAWRPGQAIRVEAGLFVTSSHIAGLAAAGIKVDGFCLLVTAERTFDADGWLRLASDERMSTLLTPTGLPIEGGVQGAVTTRFGLDFRTPVDVLVYRTLDSALDRGQGRLSEFHVSASLPPDLPPGIYRLRLDYGVIARNRLYSLNGESFARRPANNTPAVESHIFSPPVRADGRHISGRLVNSSEIRPRIPWVILADYNSNGYRGVVAEEDSHRFALSSRNLMQDDVILPMFADNGLRIAYSLEPQFPADVIETRSNIPWIFDDGELAVTVTSPDGTTHDLGKSRFLAKKGLWPTTANPAVTQWKPPAYGRYTVKATGWISDVWGNRYEGGGTYMFWIAKRMTMATATFQGFSYPLGSRYGRDIGFAPAVPADVEVNAALYVNSDRANARTISYGGKASPSGIFGAAQGMKPLPLDAPGEYYGHVLARHIDKEGHLWVCSVRHAGVVYPEDSPIVARGKKLRINGKYVDRGDTRFEGYVDPDTGISYLDHVNFPFLPGDVLLIASDQQGANKIIPVMTVDLKDKPLAYDPVLRGISRTNIKLRTANGYSPHLFPEYITDWNYFYASAPRPGFMSRFLVGEDGTRAPYWPTSPNSFGGQVGASSNGDLPGDIYRLLGGVVIRNKGENPLYAGYLASAFLLPRGSNNNRVIAAGAEDLTGSDGRKARLFLVGTRPGMTYETGATLTPVAQIDPVLPAMVTAVLTWPDGRQSVSQGQGDKFGTFVGPDRWTLDVPGVYRYQVEADWQGHKGRMPGLPAEGGEIYVVEKEKPAGATGLRLNLPGQSFFTPLAGLTINGTSTAQRVHYAAVIPGAAVDHGTVEVGGGKFKYFWNPQAIYNTTPTYDIFNLKTGKPEIGDVVHLTFFSKEKTPAGAHYHSFVRVIIRGNRVLYVP